MCCLKAVFSHRLSAKTHAWSRHVSSPDYARLGDKVASRAIASDRSVLSALPGLLFVATGVQESFCRSRRLLGRRAVDPRRLPMQS